MNSLKSLLAKIAGMTLKTKIISGVIAGALTISVAGSAIAYNHQQTEKNKELSAVTQTDKIIEKNRLKEKEAMQSKPADNQQQQASTPQAPVQQQQQPQQEQKPAVQPSQQVQQPNPAPQPQPQKQQPAPQPQPSPAAQPAAPTQNYDETIVVPGPIRNDYNGQYSEDQGMSGQVSSKNSITYDGKWLRKMNETHRKLAEGCFNEQDVKNIGLGKYIDGKYKVSNIQVIIKGAPWSDDNTITIFEPTGIWNSSPTSSIHFDKTLVYSSNKPDFKATRLVIDFQPIK